MNEEIWQRKILEWITSKRRKSRRPRRSWKDLANEATDVAGNWARSDGASRKMIRLFRYISLYEDNASEILK